MIHARGLVERRLGDLREDGLWTSRFNAFTEENGDDWPSCSLDSEIEGVFARLIPMAMIRSSSEGETNHLGASVGGQL